MNSIAKSTSIFITLFFTFSLFTQQISAQSFTSINAGITALGRSAAAWGDYDQDGDLDLVVTGVDAGAIKITRIYRNDEGSFVDSEIKLTGVKDGAVCWGDFDHDGDLDLVLAGNSDGGDITQILRNEGGNFVDILATVPGISNGDVQWGDYENDGDLDLFITGNWMAAIYENENGIFTDIGQDFGYWSSSSMSWGDYDNDGDLVIRIFSTNGFLDFAIEGGSYPFRFGKF